MLKPERNLAMAHAPRCGKDVFRWGWNTHSGCGRSPNCDRKHETMSEQILHWAVATELIRRGGHKNRSTRIAPGNVDGMVDQLRDSNQRVYGEQPLVNTKAWWRENGWVLGDNGQFHERSRADRLEKHKKAARLGKRSASGENGIGGRN